MNSPILTSSSRRRFLTNTAVASAAAYFLPSTLFAQAAAAATDVPAVVAQGRAAGAIAKITTQTLRGNVSVLMGSGGNIAVIPGKQGKLIVDSGYSTSRPQITAALTALSPDAVTHLVNTHWHFDHTDGNEWMHSIGATIIAHDNTKTRLSTPQEITAFQAHFPPSPAGAIPTKTFADKHTIHINGETLHLTHYAPAHTDTDISVYFQNADILHTGDTFFNGFYPFIDYSSGGSINGMIAAAERTIAMTTDKTIIIPGHGALANKADFVIFHDMLVATRDAVAAQKKQGKSVEETIAAKPNAAYDAKYGGGFLAPAVYVRLVYQGV